jgi:hypothetical protein
VDNRLPLRSRFLVVFHHRVQVLLLRPWALLLLVLVLHQKPLLCRLWLHLRRIWLRLLKIWLRLHLKWIWFHRVWLTVV